MYVMMGVEVGGGSGILSDWVLVQLCICHLRVIRHGRPHGWLFRRNPLLPLNHDETLSLPEPQYPHLEDGDNSSSR